MTISLAPAELFSLRGRTVLVTGGGRGLGRALSEGASAAGARVIICGRDATTAAAAVAELEARYDSGAAAYEVDLADRAATLDFAQRVLGDTGGIDVFVHNAGYEGLQSIEHVTESTLDAILTTNLISAVLLTRAFVPAMKRNGWGRIIFLTSATTAASSIEGHGVYTASKCGLEGLARTSAVELGRFGITVNCISPGCYLTDQAKGVLRSLGEEQGKAVYNAFATMTAVGRWGEPEDLVGLLVLLAGDAGRYITGDVIRVDGGLAVKLRPS